MKRLLLLSVLMSAAAAVAQPANAVSVRLQGDLNAEAYTYGASDCGNTLTIQWSALAPLLNQCPANPASLTFWSTTSATCGTAAATGDVSYATVNSTPVNRTGTFQLKIGELPGHLPTTADGGTVINCPFAMPTALTQQLCVAYTYSQPGISGFCTAVTTPVIGTPLKLVYDTLPPSAPTIALVVAQDGAASVDFTVDSDTEEVIIEVKGPNDADFAEKGTAVVANTNTIRAEGLTNELRYEVRLRARDAAGNVSDPSASDFVTPILTYGLFGYYGSEGNKLEGGCSSASGLLPMLFVAWALRSRLRRNKGSSSR